MANPFDRFHSSETPNDDLASRVKQRFRGIAPYDLAVKDSRASGISDGRKLEFYPPEESGNPIPGKLTVEVFDPSFKGEDLENMIAADFLHHLGKTEPALIDLREQFRRSMTPEQHAIDRRAYERAKAGEFGPKETRPYDEWIETHRLDQYIGSMMLPEKSSNRREWMRMMTPGQRDILEKVEQYLREGEDAGTGGNPFDEFDASGQAPAGIGAFDQFDDEGGGEQSPALSAAAPEEQSLAKSVLKAIPKGSIEAAALIPKPYALQRRRAQSMVGDFEGRIRRARDLDQGQYRATLKEITGSDMPAALKMEMTNMLRDVRLGIVDPEDVPAFRARFEGNVAEAASAGLETLAGGIEIPEEHEGRFPVQAGRGVGSTAVFFGARLLPGGQALLPVTAGSIGMGEAVERAAKAGASDEVQAEAALLGVAPGLTDMVPVERWLRPVARLPGVKGALKGIARKLVDQGLIEGTQEAIQEFMQAAVQDVTGTLDESVHQYRWTDTDFERMRKIGLDPSSMAHRKAYMTSARAGEAAVVGFVVGALFGAGGGSVQTMLSRPERAEGPGETPPLQPGEGETQRRYDYEGGIDYEPPAGPVAKPRTGRQPTGIDAPTGPLTTSPGAAPEARYEGGIDYQPVKRPPSGPDLTVERERDAARRVEREEAIRRRDARLGKLTLPENFQDPRLKREKFRTALPALAGELVKGEAGKPIWSDIDPETEKGAGRIIGRTPSTNPDWFRNSGWTVDQVHAAVDAALSGRKLGVGQQRIVDRMLGEITVREGVSDVPEYETVMEAAKRRLEDARAVRKGFAPVSAYEEADAGDVFEETAYEAEWDAPTRAMSEIAYEAQEIDPDEAYNLIERDELAGVPESETARKLLRLIEEGRKDEREAENRTDARVAEEGARSDEEGPRDRLPAEAQKEGQAPLELIPPEAPRPRAKVPLTQAEIDAAAHDAATSDENDLPPPTEAQLAAGNYRKGDLWLNGLHVRIENPAGTRRRPEWAPLKNHYGYVVETSKGKAARGKDKDHIDIFLGEAPEDASRPVFVVDQKSPATGRWDEHKVVLGAKNAIEARKTYLANYESGWKGAGPITKFTLDEFKAWASDPEQTKRPAKRARKDNEPAAKPTAPEQGRQAGQGRSPAGERIEDFGEVLKGARKHYAQKLKEAFDLDVAAHPLSKTWPEPDYRQLLDEGADPWVVGFIRAARDEVPPKPQKSWKLDRWTKQVIALRNFSGQLLDGRIPKERVQEALKDSKHPVFREALSGRIDLYQVVGHAKSLKGVRLSKGSYSMKGGVEFKPPKVIWTVEKRAKATAFSNWPRELAQGDTREEAIANFKQRYDSLDLDQKAKKEVSFSLYSKRGEEGVWIGKKIGRDYFDIKKLDTVKAARAYLAEHHDELVQALEKFKDIPDVRRPENAPRVGIDHRAGADVTPERFSEAFGFRGVQFGNWVEGDRRQQDLNDAYDALMDLAGVLGVPPRALSLNGELGLSFGARGKGGKRAAKAHYEPDTVVINLTKRAGPGSLAHEWFHAVDNYFARARGKATEYTTEAQDVSLAAREREFAAPEGIRREMVEAFGSIVRAINRTSLRERSRSLDKRRTKEYWSTGREMAARSFESYIIEKLKDQGQSNDYLANIVSEAYWDAAAKLGLEMEGTYPYPEAAEISEIRNAFDHFFDTIQTRETEKGTAFFSRPRPERPAGPGMTVDAVEKAIAGTVLKWSFDVAPDIKVVTGARDLPEALRARTEPGAEGVYDPDAQVVYLLSGNLSSEGRAQVVLAHESVGHHTMEQVVEDWPQIVKRVMFLRKAGNETAESLYQEALERGYDPTDEDVFVREMLAIATERHVTEGPIAKLLKRIRVALRRFLRRIGIARAFDETELDELVLRAFGRIRRGRPRPARAAGDTRIRYSQPRPAFYSQMQRVLAEKLPGSGSPAQMKEAIQAFARKGQIKTEELEWSGVEEWLDSLDREKVSKAEVLEYLRANEIQVEEVVKGEPATTGDWALYEDGKEVENGLTRAEAETEAATTPNLEARPMERDPARFGEHVLPGGEQYRELLLTLKRQPGDMEGIAQRLFGKSYDQLSRVEKGRVQRELFNPGDPQFVAEGHWSEPDVLAHVRFNERTDADGKRVLFIEEIQSDWAQKGRSRGFKDKAVESRIDEVGKELEKIYRNPEFSTDDELGQRAIDLQRERDELNYGKVPPAPFVTKTESWASLAMKRMIRWAAENGFDRIAWTTGEQQATRYDLSKRISRVDLSATSGGVYAPEAGPFKSGMLEAYDLDGKKVISEFVESPEKVSDYIGKDAAEKLLAQEGKIGRRAGSGARVRSLKGIDLKIGGEGMRAFYDRILPAMLNKYVKKWGVKVGTAELAKGVPVHSLDITGNMREAALAGQPLFSRRAPGQPPAPGELVIDRDPPYVRRLKEQMRAAQEASARTATATSTISDFSAENRRIREQDRTVWAKATKLLRRQFAPGGLLPSEAFKEKITRDSQFEVIEFDVRHLVGQLERAVRSDYGRPFRKLSETVTGRLSGALSGRVDPSTPEATRTALVAMRRYIDGLSQTYVGILHEQVDQMTSGFDAGEQALYRAFRQMAEIAPAGDRPADKAKATTARNRILEEAKERAKQTWGDGKRMQSTLSKVAEAAERASLIETITGNLGRYVHRSYQAFDDRTWHKRVPDDVLNSARAYLRSRYREAGEAPEEAARLTEVVLNEILKNGTAYDNLEGFIKETKLGAKDLSVLKHRKDIAPEIRALLGEYTDPRLNFAKSATKMGRLIWNQRFLAAVRESGMDVFLFEGKDRPPEATKQITGEGNDAYSPLNGLWTFPEVEQAFRDALDREQMAGWYRGVVQLNGLIKFGKTVLSPTTAARNWQSAFFFSVANGHFDMRHMAKSVEGLREYFTQQGSGAKLRYLRRLKELGVVYDTPYAGEMMRLLDDARIEEKLLAGKSQLAFGEAMHYAQKFYQFGDDFWKIIGFENEKRLLTQHAGMTQAEAEKEAAERVRNTYPTYSMVGKAIKSLRRFPLVGTFVSFPAEIIRTTVNMLRYIARDMRTPGMRPIALRRAAGFSLAAGFAYALQELSKTWLGVDDDDEEAVRTLAAPWQRNSNFIFTSRDEEGRLRYVDISFTDPYNYWKRPLTAILRDEPWQDTMVEVLRETLEPFLGTDIGAGAVFEVLANKKLDTGGPIYKEHDLPHHQLRDMADHLRKSLQPGIASNLERTWKAIDGQRSPSGKKYELFDEGLAWIGWRMSTLDPKVSLYYRSFEFSEALREASSAFNRVIRDPNEVDDDELITAYRHTVTMRKRAFTDMGRIVRAAQKSGLSDTQIRLILKASNISEENIFALVFGKIPPWRPSERALERAANKARVLINEETGKSIRERGGRMPSIVRRVQTEARQGAPVP